jgi:methylglyoxal reductase
MKYMRLGKSDIETSVVALGTIRFGLDNTLNDLKQTKDLLDYTYDIGINFIDTAPVYGPAHSEEFLGKALVERRDRFVLQTKCGLHWYDKKGEFEYKRGNFDVYRNLNPEYIRKDLEDSLKRLKTDYIDIYITHRQQPNMVPIEDTVGELQRMLDEGKILAIGISNANEDEFKTYCNLTEVTLIQQKLSLLDQTFIGSHFPICEKFGTTFQSWGALEHGALTGRAFVESVKSTDDPRCFLSPWLRPEVRSQMLGFLKFLDDTSKIYDCTLATIVEAITLKMFPNINLLVGATKINHLKDVQKSIEIVISDEDFKKITEKIELLNSNRPDVPYANPTNQS